MGVPADESATLVLASYNHAAFIADALASYAAQDHPQLRLIITDDASTDDSVAVIERELEMRNLDATTVFHSANSGICATFNDALALVETPYVAFLAADDWMEPERFSRQVPVLSSEPDSALVYSDMWVVHQDGSSPTERISDFWADRWPRGRHEDLYLDLVKTNWIPAPTVLSRTECLRSVGGYDPSLAIEDYDMWLRLAARGHRFSYVDEPLVSWRRTDSSLTETLNVRPQLEHDLMDLEILGRHLGGSAAIDDWLAPRLFHLAVTSHQRGSRAPAVAQVLRKCFRINPGASTLRFAVAASLRQDRKDV